MTRTVTGRVSGLLPAGPPGRTPQLRVTPSPPNPCTRTRSTPSAGGCTASVASPAGPTLSRTPTPHARPRSRHANAVASTADSTASNWSTGADQCTRPCPDPVNPSVASTTSPDSTKSAMTSPLRPPCSATTSSSLPTPTSGMHSAAPD